ncbi:MAG: hypothetical protein IK081_02405 [Lachnospiraceae bacterium]|nr:hypothetical protein [Lachnospiraceae bacterium]
MMKKKGIKVFLGIMIATMLLGMPVLAEGPEGEGGEVITLEGDDRAEVFMWFYRTYNGMVQKRLWSVTYEYWVTDWIDVGPA